MEGGGEDARVRGGGRVGGREGIRSGLRMRIQKDNTVSLKFRSPI